jgi:hypothetical protein
MKIVQKGYNIYLYRRIILIVYAIGSVKAFKNWLIILSI